MPEEASGYLLAHDRAAGPVAAPARRVAPMPTHMFLTPAPAPFDARTVGPDAVWARPLPAVSGPPWRRGRLRVEPDALVFEDEPDADLPDPVPAEMRTETSIDRALMESDRVSEAAAASELWCSLLYATLEATAWRHRVSGTVNHVGGRSLGALVATLRGAGGYLDWYCGPDFGQDERILALLSDLGWEPMPKGDIPFMEDGRNQPAPQERKGL